ncbi:hypothetical cytosolic protein [Syntrophus aciditrophicus SB]|uniref:Hypothetical cytosolic protein n=1 Tax=Syntrophus aciditrophicus (strain SB) TaxID=56780 RepID=Q2LQJ9_SYNAS|nr:hypothetical cytosolic protein [Syntrophus aciditrophicus SB]
MASSPSGKPISMMPLPPSWTSKMPAARSTSPASDRCIHTGEIVITSYRAACNEAGQIRVIPWNPIWSSYEAHRLRNVYKNSNKIICEAEQHLCLAGGKPGVFRIDSPRTPRLKSVGDPVCVLPGRPM